MIFLWLAVSLTFLAVFCLSVVVFFPSVAESYSLSKRIGTQVQSVARKRESVSLAQIFRSISQAVAPKELAERFEYDLIKAGVPLKGEEGLTLWAASLLGAGLLVFIITRDFISSLIVMIIGLAVPYFLLRSATEKRLAKFDSQISGALIIMANSMRAGFSFMQALEMVGKEMGDPISSEVRRVLREMHLGVSTEEALNNMAMRVGSADFDMVVTAILIQRQVGGNLAEVLGNISSTIRSRIQLAGEVRVLTAQGKMSGLIIGLLPVFVAMMFYFINKEYMIMLFTDPRGIMMLGVGIVLEIVGLLIIRKVIDISL